jgi:hypothetical protein
VGRDYRLGVVLVLENQQRRVTMDLINWITQNWVEITAVIGGLVTSASVIVKLTPSTTDDEILAKVISILNALALNPKK